MEKNEIESLAEEKVRRYNPEGLAPFPYQNVVRESSDLQILFVDLPEEISGAIGYEATSKQFRILINQNKPNTRINFTIGHELGHYFLHKEQIQSDILIDSDTHLDGAQILYRIDNPLERTKVETEANNFAASLLMPRDIVVKTWGELNSVEECAKIFNVSVSAMSIRLERLHLIQNQ